jgi:hypothetical protein
MFVILEGVKAGEQVITEGQMGVMPGGPVQIAAPPPAQAVPGQGEPASKPAAVAEGASKS